MSKFRLFTSRLIAVYVCSCFDRLALARVFVEQLSILQADEPGP